jgi:hypothetical protein
LGKNIYFHILTLFYTHGVGINGEEGGERREDERGKGDQQVEESKKAGKVIDRGRRLKEGGVKEREVMEKWKVMEKRDGDKGNRGDVGG